MIIGVDVDQTIVPSCTAWEDWIKKKYNIDIDKEHYKTDFEKTEYLSWWENQYLYDFMEPYRDAFKYLNKLHEEGYKIWFITKCFDKHIRSKKRFCDKYFKYERFFNSGFNKADTFDGVIHYMIDDRPSILKRFNQTKCFRVDTTVEPETDDFPLLEWEKIYNEIIGDRDG